MPRFSFRSFFLALFCVTGFLSSHTPAFACEAGEKKALSQAVFTSKHSLSEAMKKLQSKNPGIIVKASWKNGPTPGAEVRTWQDGVVHYWHLLSDGSQWVDTTAPTTSKTKGSLRYRSLSLQSPSLVDGVLALEKEHKGRAISAEIHESKGVMTYRYQIAVNDGTLSIEKDDKNNAVIEHHFKRFKH
jgi:hypothetical protein